MNKNTRPDMMIWDEDDKKYIRYYPRPEIIIWQGEEKKKGFMIPLHEKIDFEIDHLLPLFAHEAIVEHLSNGWIRVTMEIDPLDYAGTEVCKAVPDEFVNDWLELWRGEFWGKDDGKVIYEPSEGDTAFIRYETCQEYEPHLEKYLGITN